jgi:O-antigen ligase
MILYLYPFIVGCFCSAMICNGLRKRNKKMVIFFSILPCFFASPFYTVTRGAAGAITASDITGFTLLSCLFFIPSNWKTPFGIVPVKLIVLMIMIMTVSIWTMGVYTNLIGVMGSQLENLHISNRLLLPFLIAGYRLVKLLTLFAYIVFFSVIFFDAEEKAWLAHTIIMGCLILSVAKVLTVYNVTDLSLAYGNAHVGYVGPRILGQTKACAGRLLVVGIIMCLSRIVERKKSVSIIYISLLTVGLILTGSRGAIGALLVALATISVTGRLRGFLVAGLAFMVIFISGLFVLNFNKDISQKLLQSFSSESLDTASDRVPIWRRTVRVWLENPSIILFGVGAFNFGYARLSIGYETAHNDMLTVGSELGLCSMLLFLSWLLSMALLFWRNIKTSRLNEKWNNICVLSIFIGLLFAGIFEATLYPTISTLPMVRVLTSLLFVFGLSKYKQCYLNEKKERNEKHAS